MTQITQSDSAFQLGEPIVGWTGCHFPPHEMMVGKEVSLAPITNFDYTQQLFDSYKQDESGTMWNYLPYGPFNTVEEYKCWIKENCMGTDPQFYAVIDNKTNSALGVTSYLRIVPEHGVIEVGHLAFSPMLQRTRLATESMYLMMKYVFEKGYRRYEWKCNSLNSKSRYAAERIGMTFEGVFRQMMVTKGRNRDTVWYSIIDKEWPAIEKGFLEWLDDKNFDDDGMQKLKLLYCINQNKQIYELQDSTKNEDT